jgi:hypothetical protein
VGGPLTPHGGQALYNSLVVSPKDVKDLGGFCLFVPLSKPVA